MSDMPDLTSRRIADYVWGRAGLDPEETIDHQDQAEFAQTVQNIIDEKGPKWLLEKIVE